MFVMYVTQLMFKMKSTILAKYFNMVLWILDRQMRGAPSSLIFGARDRFHSPVANDLINHAYVMQAK